MEVGTEGGWTQQDASEFTASADGRLHPSLQKSTNSSFFRKNPKKMVRELDFDFIRYIAVVKILNSWS